MNKFTYRPSLGSEHGPRIGLREQFATRFMWVLPIDSGLWGVSEASCFRLLLAFLSSCLFFWVLVSVVRQSFSTKRSTTSYQGIVQDETWGCNIKVDDDLVQIQHTQLISVSSRVWDTICFFATYLFCHKSHPFRRLSKAHVQIPEAGCPSSQTPHEEKRYTGFVVVYSRVFLSSPVDNVNTCKRALNRNRGRR